MNRDIVDKIVRTVLYEGYILYPYRRATKNEQRWTFGCLFPQAYSEAKAGRDPCRMHTQCLLHADEKTGVTVEVRFLQLVDRAVSRRDGDDWQAVDELEIGGKRHQSWQEGQERSALLDLTPTAVCTAANIVYPAEQMVEVLHDEQNEPAGKIVRTSHPLEAEVQASLTPLRDDVWRLDVRVLNRSPLPDGKISRATAQLQAMASCHGIYQSIGGRFISAIDPPAAVADLAAACKQTGAWPMLVGKPGDTDAMLASPIILYDYPQVAPESPGDLFDGGEIDEILSLRIMTLTDAEKKAGADLDPHAAELIHRTENLARAQLARLHGALRQPPRLQAIHIGASELHLGDKVILHPRRSADAFDLLLAGKCATIAAIEQDYEGHLHLAVTVDDDPGADLGVAGKIAHRFYFRPEEVEPAAIPSSPGAPAFGSEVPIRRAEGWGHSNANANSILIAAIGNIFLSDDAFGFHVAQRLARRALPPNVKLIDFGIRALDLVYALMEPWQAVVMIDAVPNGNAPGTLCVIEPEIPDAANLDPLPLEGHAMNPVRVLQAVRAMGAVLPPVRIVGCEPAPIDPQADIQPDLSPAVARAIEPAVEMVLSLVRQMSNTLSLEADHVSSNLVSPA